MERETPPLLEEPVEEELEPETPLMLLSRERVRESGMSTLYLLFDKQPKPPEVPTIDERRAVLPLDIFTIHTSGSTALLCRRQEIGV